MNHSYEIDMLGAQLDFQGIILLMWSAAIPLVYYGFYCEIALRYTYWALVRGTTCCVETRLIQYSLHCLH